MKSLLKSITRIVIGASTVLGLALFIMWIAIARPIGTQAPNDPFIPTRQITDNLERHVRVLSEDILNRNWEHPEQLDKAANYIRSEWEALGLTVEEQVFEIEGQDFRNLIVRFEGAPGPKTVIGAHYDVAHDLPGADDNASGTAGLVELARLLKKTPPSRSVELVAYTLEEPPAFGTQKMGSFAHAEREHSNEADIDLMISLEMIGYFTDEPNTQFFPLEVLSLFYPNRGNFIGVVDKLNSRQATRVKRVMRQATDLPVHSINGPAALPGINFSDHLNYWHFGYDAVMITDTSFYRNKAYHTKDDTADRLDYTKMAKVVGAVAAFVSD